MLLKKDEEDGWILAVLFSCPVPIGEWWQLIALDAELWSASVPVACILS